MKRFPICLKLKLKKGLKLIPSFLLSILITAAAAALAAAVFSTVMGERSILPKAVVAIVAGSDGTDDTVETGGMPDFKTMMMIGVVEGMDSIRSVCSFSYMSPRQAADALADGSVSAAVYLPDGIYEDIDSGENTPVKVRLAGDGTGLLSGLFRALTESGVTLIRAVESSIYAMDILSGTYTLTADLPVLEDAVFNTYINGALSRNALWNPENVSQRSGLSLRDFIVTSAALLLLLLFGIGFRAFYTRDEKDSAAVLARQGLPRPAVSAAVVLSSTVVFAILSALLAAAVRLTLRAVFPGEYALPSPAEALLLLPAIAALSFSAAAYAHFLYSAVPEKGSGLFYLLITVLLYAACGGLLPAAYLPGVLRQAALHSPVAAWQAALSAVLFGGGAAAAVPAALWGAVLLAAGEAAALAGRRLTGRERTAGLSDGSPAARPASGAGSDRPGSACTGPDRPGPARTGSDRPGSARSGSAHAGPDRSRSGLPLLLRLRILLLRDLRKPSRWMVLGAGLLLFYVVCASTLPSAANHTVGLVDGGGALASETVRALTENDSILDYVLYEDREALADAVVSEKVDCGFVLDDRIDAAAAAQMGGITFPVLDGCADYLFTTSTTKGEAAKEEVYATLFGLLSESVMLHDIRTGAIFTDPDEDMAAAFLAEMRAVSDSGETFRVDYEYMGLREDGDGDGEAAAGNGETTARNRKTNPGNGEAARNGAGAPVWPAAVLMIFAAALLFSQTAFYPEQAAVTAFLRSSGFTYTVLETLSPLIPFGAAMTAAAAAASGGLPLRAALLAPFLIACALWAVLFTKLFRRSQTLCLFAAVAVILAAAVLSDGITGSAMLPGAAKYLRFLLPGSWPVI